MLLVLSSRTLSHGVSFYKSFRTSCSRWQLEGKPERSLVLPERARRIIDLNRRAQHRQIAPYDFAYKATSTLKISEYMSPATSTLVAIYSAPRQRSNTGTVERVAAPWGKIRVSDFQMITSTTIKNKRKRGVATEDVRCEHKQLPLPRMWWTIVGTQQRRIEIVERSGARRDVHSRETSLRQKRDWQRERFQ